MPLEFLAQLGNEITQMLSTTTTHPDQTSFIPGSSFNNIFNFCFCFLTFNVDIQSQFKSYLEVTS